MEQLGEEGAPDPDIPQLYEEIKDLQTPGTAASSRVAAPVPQYEDVMPAVGVSKSSDSYQITQCSAYGVSVNN